MKKKEKYFVAPNPKDLNLTKKVSGFDENNKKIKTRVINEKSLTIFLNDQEIVTLMSIGDYSKYLEKYFLSRLYFPGPVRIINKQKIP